MCNLMILLHTLTYIKHLLISYVLDEQNPVDEHTIQIQNDLIESDIINSTCTPEYTDTDGSTANEFYVEYEGRLVKYDPSLCVEDVINSLDDMKRESDFVNFCSLMTTHWANTEWNIRSKTSLIVYKISETEHGVVVPIFITIQKDFSFQVTIHGQSLNPFHELYKIHGCFARTVDKVKKITDYIQLHTICIGNPDPIFQSLVPHGAKIMYADEPEFCAYRECDWGDQHPCKSTIRSTKCDFLTSSVRCKNCCKYRHTLRGKVSRERKKTSSNTPHQKANLRFLSKSELLDKCKMRTREVNTLKMKVRRLEQQIKESYEKNAENLDIETSTDMKIILEDSTNTVHSDFP